VLQFLGAFGMSEHELIQKLSVSKERFDNALEIGDKTTLASVMSSLPVEDLALLLTTLSDNDLREFASLTKTFFDLEVVLELGVRQKKLLIEALDIANRLDEIKNWDTDDLMSLLDFMSWEEKQRALAACAPQDREILALMGSYPEGTAARLLERSMVVVPSLWRAEETVQHITNAEGIPEEFQEVYVVNLRNQLVGVVYVGTLLRADQKMLMQDLAKDVHRIAASMEQEEVVYAFRHYNLLTAPVESIDGQLLGIVSADDIMSIADEEAGEDMLKLAGVSHTDEAAPAHVQTMHRVIWLSVVVMNSLLSALVIEHFQTTIEHKGVLAALMTLVSAVGGAAGTQVLAVSIRGLSLRVFQAKGVGSIFAREMGINLMGSLMVGAILAAVTYFWLGEVILSTIVFLSLLFSMSFAAVCGVYLPWAIHRLGFDPTISAAPLVGAVCDVLGFSVFLWLASMAMGVSG